MNTPSNRSLTWSQSRTRRTNNYCCPSRRKVYWIFLRISFAIYLIWQWVLQGGERLGLPIDSSSGSSSSGSLKDPVYKGKSAFRQGYPMQSAQAKEAKKEIRIEQVTASTLEKQENAKPKGNQRPKPVPARTSTPPWQNCSWQPFDGIDLIHVANSTTTKQQQQKPQRIYCFIMSHNERKGKLRAVFETWGTKCDYMLVASNETDSEFNAVHMKAKPTYENLWNKLNETMQYINATTNGFQDYDWYFKVDDDTYVIMENLHAFLQSPSVQDEVRRQEPLIYGRLFAYPTYQALPRLANFFNLPTNEPFRRKFTSNFNGTKRLVYASGGAGYIMNQQFASLFLNSFDSEDSLYGEPDEDMAVAVNALVRGVTPRAAKDAHGLQLFHPELPPVMYHLPQEQAAWLFDNHKDLGGIFPGPLCCSPYSVSFHHVMPMVMRYMNHRVYHCSKKASPNPTKV